MYWHRKLVAAFGAAGMILVPVAASAQQADVPLTLDPSNTRPAPEPEPEPEPEPAPAPAAAPGQPGAEGQEAVDEQGFYHYDDYDDYVDERETLDTHGPAGAVPELHVVRQGDTLWDICGYYFSNPWEWPKIWSYNPSITNPHWIYPGDVVRLHAASMQARVVDPAEPEPEAIEARAPTPLPATGVRLRQLAFVEDEQLETAFTITGAEEERLMLSQNDVVYLEYPEGKPPQVGRRYAVYSPTETVRHPDDEKSVGHFVRVLGEVEVLSVKKDKRARAVVRESNEVIERGARVGPLQRTYKDVDTVPNKQDRQGTIVAQLSGNELIGAHQLVIIDIGAGAGVQAGNRMFVVRRGDALPEQGDRSVGSDDRRFPAYAVGEILVVQAGKSTSVGVVTLSLQEFSIGDHVLMRKAR